MLHDHESRRLAWNACVNARDVGGYQTLDGERIRSHALVRTDNLHHLTPEAQRAVLDYGVRTVLDLRMLHELEIHPNPFATPQAGLDSVQNEGSPRYLNLQILERDDTETSAALDEATSMADEYRVMLSRRKESIGAAIKAVVAGLGEGGVLVHCHGGKDRTGIVVALLLSLAGVPRETVTEDYALSEERLEPYHAAWLEEQSKAQGAPVERPRWMASRPETMRDALSYLDQEYGGVEAYLQTAGVTRAEVARIRRYLTAPADNMSL
ncbi:MAG: tyrosine-protein phosphatase [Chloroflexota bacterium]|nr:tyrosine-protein phosphatase [Chloroflexota bacterium]